MNTLGLISISRLNQWIMPEVLANVVIAMCMMSAGATADRCSYDLEEEMVQVNVEVNTKMADYSVLTHIPVAVLAVVMLMFLARPWLLRLRGRCPWQHLRNLPMHCTGRRGASVARRGAT